MSAPHGMRLGELATQELARDATATGAEILASSLVALGATHAFGLLGSAVAPFYDALHASGLSVVHTRHEAGAVFMATEASIATGRPGVVYTTTGPGLANAVVGLAAATSEGARVVVVAAATDRAKLGRGAFQETGPAAAALLDAFPGGRSRTYAAYVDGREELESAIDALARGLRGPRGLVALLLVPPSVQCERAPRALATPRALSAAPRAVPDAAVVDEAAARLARAPFVVWAGSGAVAAAERVRALVEHTGARFMATPRGKGIVPETHPSYLGVTGIGGHARVASLLGTDPPEHTLVLGSRLGEFDSFFDPALAPRCSFVHVDHDPRAFARAYPSVPTLGIRGDVGDVVDLLLARLPACDGSRRPLLSAPPLDAPSAALDGEAGLDPRLVMQALQRVVVEGSDAVVMAEAGNSFAWTSHCLRFAQPGRHRVSTGFGSMGHFAAGVVGAALASGRKVVAVVGDGALAMNDELSTAAAHGARAVWVVLNDARYGMVEHGMRAIGLAPLGLSFPRIDFALVARARGAAAVTVRDPEELAGALRAALAAPAPFVVDVHVDARVAPPFGKRNELLYPPRSGER